MESTERDKEVRRELMASCERTERPEMAKERMAGVIRTLSASGFYTSLVTARDKAISLSHAVRRIAFALGMSYDELRFALITTMIFVDSSPSAVRKACVDGRIDYLTRMVARDGDTGPAMDACERLTDVAATVATEHGWQTALDSLITVESVVWDSRALVDQTRFEKESKRKLDELKSRRAAGWRGTTPVTPVAADLQERPRPFTWEEYMRSITGGPESVINDRLDRVNAGSSSSQFPADDEEPITIRDLDTGRTTSYSPPVVNEARSGVADRRLFTADADGHVTIRKPSLNMPEPETTASPSNEDEYWCSSCGEFHGTDDTE